MNYSETKFTIGKKGITDGVIDSIVLATKNHKLLRISMLKASGRDKQKMEEAVSILREKLPFTFVHRIIGFTIVLKKRSSAVKPAKKK